MYRIGKSIAAALALAVVATAAAAQDFPNKPITVIVPFAAGGPTDTVARLVAQSMTNYLKQQVIVENAGGAGGTIGANKVAKSKPDGYTLLLHHIGHTTAPSLYRKLPYDTLNDFEPIGLITDVPMTIISKKDFAPKDMKDLVAGEFIYHPKGTLEWMENASDKDVTVLVAYSPGGMDEFFSEAAEPAKNRVVPPTPTAEYPIKPKITELSLEVVPEGTWVQFLPSVLTRIPPLPALRSGKIPDRPLWP